MNEHCESGTYVGQVECDPAGMLWAVLYHRDQLIERERVRSLRHGKRRVINMVLAASDAFPDDSRRPVQVPLNRIPTEQHTVGRHRPAAVAQLARAGRGLAI